MCCYSENWLSVGCHWSLSLRQLGVAKTVQRSQSRRTLRGKMTKAEKEAKRTGTLSQIFWLVLFLDEPNSFAKQIKAFPK